MISVPLIVDVPTNVPVYAAVALTSMIRFEPACRTLLNVADVLPTVPLAEVGGDAAAPVVATAARKTASGTSTGRRPFGALMVTPLGSVLTRIRARARRPDNPNKLGFLGRRSYPWP